MPTVVLQLFARQGTGWTDGLMDGWMDGWTDGQSGDYMLPPLGSIKKILLDT